MKKFITSIIMASLFVTLTACGGGSQASGSTNEFGLIEDGKILAATSPDYAPFEYLEGSTITGFDIDLLNAVAAKSGLEVEYTSLAFDTIISAVQAGQYDVGMSAFTKTEERSNDVLFGSPYYTTSQVALLPLDSPATTLDDLKDKKLGAGMGTTGETAALTLSTDVPIVDASTGLPMLQANQLDAYICDIGVAQNAVATGKYKMIDTPISTEETAMIFKIGNDALCTELNKSLDEFKQTQEYKDLLTKYNLN